jgi:hypothetical protein
LDGLGQENLIMKPIKEYNKTAVARIGVVRAGVIALSIGMITFAGIASAADGPNTCASRDKVVRALSDVYAENPVSLGLTEEGAVIEVMASSEGSFTIVITHPNGLTCPIAAGTAWQSITAKIMGDGV